jgi:hypothetical protein
MSRICIGGRVAPKKIQKGNQEKPEPEHHIALMSGQGEFGTSDRGHGFRCGGTTKPKRRLRGRLCDSTNHICLNRNARKSGTFAVAA